MDRFLTRIASDPRARGVVQVVVIAALVVAAIGGIRLGDDSARDEARADTVQTVLAYTCAAAKPGELRASGLTAECRAAQDGDLLEELPADDLAEDPAAATDPDLLPDQPGTAIDQPEDLDGDTLRTAVVDYFETNPITDSPLYTRTIQRAVTAYLRANDPSPSESQIRQAVRTVVLANPPSDGVDGAAGATGAAGLDGADGSDGVGIASTTTDGCDVVFSYTDGSSDRVGPLCGPDPTAEQVQQGVQAYCDANGGCAGPPGPTCPDGFNPQEVRVETGDSALADDTRTIIACVPV